MLAVFAFLLALGPLVIFHEFGHYFFARLFGVKAEIFSIGFGPTLWKRQLGETELRVSAIPLGGYVKLLGEDRESEMTPELAKRALHKQAAWKRFFIFFGGPLFNFIAATFIFGVILMIGEPQLANVIGRVVQHSTAEKTGLRSGDRVVSIGGKPMARYDDIMNTVSESPSKPLEFAVIHPGSTETTKLTVTPSTQDGFSVYGEQMHVGEIEGMLPVARAPLIGVSNSQSLVAKAGLKSGDLLEKLNGQAIKTWEEVDAAYAAAAPQTVFHFAFVKQSDGKTEVPLDLTKTAADATMASAWGLNSSELFVEKVQDGSPAQKAGVKDGDRLIGVGKRDVESFFELKDAVQRAGESEGRVDLRWERNGQALSASIVPNAATTKDALLKNTTQYTVGVVPMLTNAEPITILERTFNPFKLAYRATERMVVFSWRNLISIQKMFTGDVSVKTLGGPIMIGKIAGESLSRGLVAFLTTMAILSIGLGVLNVLPIPVLDGGHLLLLAIEAIRGKPLSLRQMEIIQGVGLSLILLLMVVVFRNDFMRLDLPSLQHFGK